jgi:hypothetical protein
LENLPPRNYGTDISVISAMGLRGLVVTVAFEGAVDTLCFDAYAERVLGPCLRRGDVVALDNLGAHKASGIEEVAESRGAQVQSRTYPSRWWQADLSD